MKSNNTSHSQTTTTPSWNWQDLLEKATISKDEKNPTLNPQYSNFIYRFLVYESVTERKEPISGIDRHGRGCSLLDQNYSLEENNAVVLQKMHSFLKEKAKGTSAAPQQAKVENLLEEFRRK